MTSGKVLAIIFIFQVMRKRHLPDTVVFVHDSDSELTQWSPPPKVRATATTYSVAIKTVISGDVLAKIIPDA